MTLIDERLAPVQQQLEPAHMEAGPEPAVWLDPTAPGAVGASLVIGRVVNGLFQSNRFPTELLREVHTRIATYREASFIVPKDAIACEVDELIDANPSFSDQPIARVEPPVEYDENNEIKTGGLIYLDYGVDEDTQAKEETEAPKPIESPVSQEPETAGEFARRLHLEARLAALMIPCTAQELQIVKYGLFWNALDRGHELADRIEIARILLDIERAEQDPNGEHTLRPSLLLN